MWKNIDEGQKATFNKLATHPLQSFEWGEFRDETGIKVILRGFFKNNKLISTLQLTIHKIPHTSFTIGYVPKGTMPTNEMLKELQRIGKEEKCIFIQLEPNIVKNKELGIRNYAENEYNQFTTLIHNSKFIIHESARPLFTKYTFLLDLTKSEEQLLSAMHPKTRYNIKVAQKHEVIVKEENDESSFNSYLKLTEETTNRQGFFAHTKKYHELMWKTLQEQPTRNNQQETNTLKAHLLVTRYNNIPLTTWILFTFHDTLYYPYGASSSEYRNVMSSSAMMWEAIKFGKKLGLKKFDMWGSLGENPDPHDSWYGFHKFKQGFGPELVEFVGSYDLVINPLLYQGYKLADKLRWVYLSLKSR